MSSPEVFHFPMPPQSNRGSQSHPNGVATASQCTSTTHLLGLTQRFRTQTATLVAKQESLLAQHKAVFELERELWKTEREMWEEERRVLLQQLEASKGGVTARNSVTSPHTRHFSAVSIGSTSNSTSNAKKQHDRKRESSGGGSGIGWFLKQGSSAQNGMMGSAPPEISPRSTFTPPTQSAAFTPRATFGSGTGFNPMAELRQTQLQAQNIGHPLEDDEIPLDLDDLSELPPSLMADASRSPYVDRERKASTQTIKQKSNTAAVLQGVSGNGQTRSNGTNTPSDFKSVRADSRTNSKSARVQRGSHYLASFSEDSSDAEAEHSDHGEVEEDDDDDDDDDDEDPNLNISPQAVQGEITPKIPTPTFTDTPAVYTHLFPKATPIENTEDELETDEEPVVLKLRTSTNFGISLGSLRKANSTSTTSREKATQNRKRMDVLSTSTFYDPETPIDGSSISSSANMGWVGLPSGSIPPPSHLSHSSTDTRYTRARTIDGGEPWVPPQSWMQPSTLEVEMMPTQSLPPSRHFYNHPYAGDSFTIPESMNMAPSSPDELTSPVRELDIRSHSVSGLVDSPTIRVPVGVDSPTYVWTPPAPTLIGPPAIPAMNSKRPPPISSIGMEGVMSPPLSAVPLGGGRGVSTESGSEYSVEQGEKMKVASMDGVVVAPIEVASPLGAAGWTGEGGMI